MSRTRTRGPGVFALGFALALMLVGLQQVGGVNISWAAPAPANPPGCLSSNIQLGLTKDKVLVTNGDTVTFNVTVVNPQNATNDACNVANATTTFYPPQQVICTAGGPVGAGTVLQPSPLNYPVGGPAVTYTPVSPNPNPVLAQVVNQPSGTSILRVRAQVLGTLQDGFDSSASACKDLAVQLFELQTQASTNAAVTPGTAVSDTLNIICPTTGNATAPCTNPDPNGTVTFFLCGPTVAAQNCTTGGANVGTSPVLGASTSSQTIAPTTPGFYCFRAEWTPNADSPYFNPAVPVRIHTNSTTECFSVTVPPAVTITTQANASGGVLPVTVTDTATISGNSGPAAGTVDFFLCDPTQITAAGCPTGGTAVTGNPVTIVAGQATSGTTSLGAGAIPGKYCYRVVYNPAPGSPYAGIPVADRTHTNATTECFTVTPPGPGGETDLEVDKFCNDPQEPLSGQPFTCTIFVVNNGPNTATGVVMTDTIPAGLIYVSDDRAECVFTGTLGQPGGTVVCTVGTLPVGTTFTAHIIFRPVVVFTPTAVINVVDITATSPLTNNPGNHHFEYRTWVFPYEADMTITGHVSDTPPTLNQASLYTFEVKNNGSHRALDPVASIEFTPGVVLGAITTAPGWTCAPTGSKITCKPTAASPQTFAHGASAVFTVRYTPTTTADVTVKLHVESNQTSTNIDFPGAVDRNLGNNDYSQVIGVRTLMADLAVQVSDNVDPVTGGNNVVYTIRVKNNGPDAANNVSLANVLGGGATFVSGTGACTANQAACNLGTIANGQELVVTVTVKSPAAAGSMSLKATATTTSANDNNSGNNSATETTQVNAAAPSARGATTGGSTGGSTGGRR